MLKLKSSYRLGNAPTCIYVMSENVVHRFDKEYELLLQVLSTTGLDADLITPENIEQLNNLDQLKIIEANSTNDPVLNLLEFDGYKKEYVKLQRNHLKLKLVNHLSDEFYYNAICDKLKQLDVNLIDTNETFSFHLVSRPNELKHVEYPASVIKLGSYRVSIGPMLSPLVTLEQFNEHYSLSKIYFDKEAFSADLPQFFKDMSVMLVVKELFKFVVEVGSHKLVKGIIIWDLPSMRRTTYDL
jgi:hypothetical protein